MWKFMALVGLAFITGLAGALFVAAKFSEVLSDDWRRFSNMQALEAELSSSAYISLINSARNGNTEQVVRYLCMHLKSAIPYIMVNQNDPPDLQEATEELLIEAKGLVVELEEEELCGLPNLTESQTLILPKNGFSPAPDAFQAVFVGLVLGRCGLS